MAEIATINSYKEIRLDLDPTTQGSTIAIRVPQHGSSSWASRTASKRSHIAEIPAAEDEISFRKWNLATASSIYYRKHYKSPRAFLWRILEEEKVLSIQAADLSRQRNTPDYHLTLRLSFTSPIKSGCIALCDPVEHDVLNVFALTESNHLYTLTLRPEYFRRPSSTEDNVGDWCKSYHSATFGFRQPHRLVALTADELMISLYDGGLMKLDKGSGADGTEWKETFYNEGGWGQQLRSLIPFQGNSTIKHGKHNMELSAAISIASPRIEINGYPYVITVSLDHRLRVWNLITGRIVYMRDILNQDLEPADAAKVVIHPSHTQLVKVFGENEESALCVTYSPLGTGQFKFWKISSASDGSLDVTDLFLSNELVPRIPTSDLWTLADFSVVLDRTNINSFSLWTLWKNNTTYHVQKLAFHTASVARVRDAWRSGWVSMASEALRDPFLPSIVQGDPDDATDKWMDFVFCPSRFTQATLETALAIYRSGLTSSSDTSRDAGPLPERICSVIASTTSMNRTSDGTLDYEQFRVTADQQWRRFYRLLLELDKQRGEALSLVVDPQGEMPWVTLADGITAVRECSGLEQIWHNPDATPSGAEHVATLVMAATNFRESLSDLLVQNVKSNLLKEIFEEPSHIDSVRMRLFYDRCDFANQIGDEEYAQLVANLGGNFKDVTPQVYEALLELMGSGEDIEKRAQQSQIARFGNKLVVRGIQETVDLQRNVCLDQLILLVLIEAEINHGEEGIQFETASVFSQLLSMLRTFELISWLASTQISLPFDKSERRESITDKAASLNRKTPSPSTEMVTVLEGVMRHLIGLDPRRDETMPYVVTELFVQVCSPDSEYEAPPSVIQCYLLKHERADLAMEFSRFAGPDAFSVYVQGRAHLAVNDALTASMLFKKAAFGMAHPDPKKRTDYRTAGFLDEMERNLLNAGLAQYYSHIVSLFDKEKNYSMVIDFSRLSLQFIPSGNIQPQITPFRTEMLSRLFNATIQTSRYELALSTVLLLTNEALQASCLRTLVTKMCESSYAAQLIELPFIGLHEQVDDILTQKCHGIVDVNAGVAYHKILYAWRIKRGDFRGAAAISLERLQRLQQSEDRDKMLGDGSLDTPVTRQYVALINALSCVDPKQAWILSEELPGKYQAGIGPISEKQPKRKVVSLDDVRRGYQGELDRIAAIENNQFAFAGGDEMDVLRM